MSFLININTLKLWYELDTGIDNGANGKKSEDRKAVAVGRCSLRVAVGYTV